MPGALLVLLLLTPKETHEFTYVFEKGLTFESKSELEVKLRLFTAEGRIFKHHMKMETVLERTVMEVDAEGQPTVERVLVKTWTADFISWPDREPGKKSNAAEGKAFVWRVKNKKGEWGLFDRKEEVTDKHPGLVEKLQPWRAARAPGKPVAVGDRWEVTAATFLAAAGMQVPANVAGRATFKLEEVKDGTAWVSFELKMAYEDQGRTLTGEQKGVWKFDLKNHRDLSFRVDGQTEVDNGRSGFGTVKMSRTITYR